MIIKGKKRLRVAAFLAAVMLTAGVSLSMNGTRTAAPLTAYAEEEYTYGETASMYYRKYSDHIEISSAKSMEVSSIEIPESIDGLPVTAIGMYAFQLSEAKTISFPDTITFIDAYTFSGCKNLTEVTLPKNLKTIRFHSFEDCTSLATINFPDEPVQAGDYTFDNTPWLEEQRKKNPLVIVNNAVIDGRTCEGDVTIPAGTKCIATGAFSRNEKITSVVVPSSVTGFFENTFWYCSNLTSVELNGATQLGDGVFGACNKLTDLKLSGKLTTIDGYAFTDNTAAATITFYGSQSTWNQVQKPDNDGFLQRANMVFDENHQEEIVDPPTTTEPPIEFTRTPGDVNCDGSITVSDAILVARIAAEDVSVKVTDIGMRNADVDGVSGISSDDTTLLLKFIAGSVSKSDLH